MCKPKSATEPPKPRQLGFMKDYRLLGDVKVEDFDDLWDPDETVREWDELIADARVRVEGKRQHHRI